MTLKEQAWQSGLVLMEETAEWNQNDWPPLAGGWREDHATVIIGHPAQDNDSNNKRQTVVVMGGCTQGQGELDSVLVLNLSEPNKQWREGPPLKKNRSGHAAVVCNESVYVMGGHGGSFLDCIERIDANYLLNASFTNRTTHKSHWTTLNCRLSTGRSRCGAVAIQNRYIVVMGGWNLGYLSSMDIIDIKNQTVIKGPHLAVPRSCFASAVVGHRIFVVGGSSRHGNLDSVEYLDLAKHCAKDETKKETASTIMFFSSTWTILSDLVLSNARGSCAMVAVGSCLVVAGGQNIRTVEILDTHRNRVWNLPPFGNHHHGCSMVTVANQLAVIGGRRNPSCATLPLMDQNSWCFRRLCEQKLSGWHLFREGMDISSFSTSTSKSE